MLAIVFIALKLSGVITWPWLWVLAPLWIPAALTLVSVLIALLVALVALIFVKFFLKGILKCAQGVTINIKS